MNSFDLTFVGNGILSYVPALEAKKEFPELKVAMIGPANQEFSASVAAGAMHAVFCEVEETFHHSPRDQEIFATGLESRPLWHDLITRFNLQEVVTANSTIMYRRKESTPFEKSNFDSACAIAEDHKCLEDVTQKELDDFFTGPLRSSDIIAKKFIGEFAIDAARFFKLAKLRLEEMGVTFIDAKAKSVVQKESGLEITLDTNETVQSQKAIMAAGSESGKLLPDNFPIVPIYHAVGTAMLLDSAPEGYSNSDFVVRTPNRGGAQCGMHIVPRNAGQFYLGAGNYLSNTQPAHRVETIRYLIDICERELYGKQSIYNAKAELLLGSRPKSVDGFPVIGTCKEFPNIYVATGTYRIGLTIAPVVANEINAWLNKKEASAKFKKWSPDRELHSYAPLDVAIRYFSESRISNLIEHGLLNAANTEEVAAKKVELQAIAENYNADIVKKHNLPADFVVDPDMYAILASTAPFNAK